MDVSGYALAYVELCNARQIVEKLTTQLETARDKLEITISRRDHAFEDLRQAEPEGLVDASSPELLRACEQVVLARMKVEELQMQCEVAERMAQGAHEKVEQALEWLVKNAK